MKKSELLRFGLIGFCLLAVSWEVHAAPPTSQPARPKRGEIVRVDKDHITAMPSKPAKDDQPDKPITYRMNNSTDVSLARLTREHTTPAGERERTYEFKPGSRDDLKVGLRARIDADGEVATRIIVYIDDPQKP